MNRKGQALVEFVLIIPVFILLVLGVLEFGNIIYQKYQLESKLDYIVELYKADELDEASSYASKEKINVNYSSEDNFTKINVSKQIKVSAPVVSNILGKYYTVSVSRVILNEQ